MTRLEQALILLKEAQMHVPMNSQLFHAIDEVFIGKPGPEAALVDTLNMTAGAYENVLSSLEELHEAALEGLRDLDATIRYHRLKPARKARRKLTPRK